ncbi:MAG: rhomboid family intramembrane serine protease [Myxococcales bacterium]|nr:rhomboid family intramembrane serine protease [Myxococcales bacterium]
MRRVATLAFLRARTPHVWVTPLVCALNAAVFVAAIVMGVAPLAPSGDDLIEWGASFAPLNTDGAWWRLLTSTVTHAGLWHLGNNLVVLALAGRLAERLAGNTTFLATYLGAGLVGAATGSAAQPHAAVVGASGGVLGVVGLLLGVFLRRQRDLTEQGLHRQVGAYAGVCAASLGGSFWLAEASLAAHLGGLGLGVAAGLLLGPRLEPRRGRAKWAASVALASVAIAVGITLGTPSAAAAAERGLARFEALERTLVPLAESAFAADTTGGLAGPDADGCARLERAVFTPWNAERASLEAVRDVPRALEGRVRRVLDYMRLRADGWQLHCEGVRDGRTDRLEAAAVARRMADHEAEALASARP